MRTTAIKFPIVQTEPVPRTVETETWVTVATPVDITRLASHRIVTGNGTPDRNCEFIEGLKGERFTEGPWMLMIRWTGLIFLPQLDFFWLPHAEALSHPQFE